MYDHSGPLPRYCYLPTHFQLTIDCEQSQCHCGGAVRIQWLSTRKPISLVFGRCVLRVQVKYCPLCKRSYYPCGLDDILPPLKQYDYALIVTVGLLRYVHHKQHKEIQQVLWQRYRLHVPLSSISEVSQTFLDYLVAVHRKRSSRLGAFMNKSGGYILAVDGTCEAGTDILFGAMEPHMQLVLWATVMPTENVRDISTFLHQCKDFFGPPLATLCDLSPTIGKAIQSVFPDKPALICQYHFLAAVGEKLLRTEHGKLTNYISRKLKMRVSLTTLRKDLNRYSKNINDVQIKQVDRLLSEPELVEYGNIGQQKRTFCYALLQWLIDYKADLKGEYIPFDLPSLAFYRRARTLYELVQGVISKNMVSAKQWHVLYTIQRHLEPVVKDRELLAIVSRLEKAEKLFSKLREALCLSYRQNRPILRQRGGDSARLEVQQRDTKISCIYSELVTMTNSHQDDEQRKNAQIVIDYLDKYWEHLFGHATKSQHLDKQIIVDRTNNVIETKFGTLKHGYRRKLGTKKLGRSFKAARAEEMIALNLQKQTYIDLVYDGDLKNMPAYFKLYGQENNKVRKLRKSEKKKHEIHVTKKCLRDSDLLKNVEVGMEKLIKKIGS